VNLRGNNGKRWTPEDDQRLLALLKAEASWTLISATLKRRINAVRNRIYALKHPDLERSSKAEEE
jgi:Myb-like DNA-binding domain